jgi:hypothetical protein
VRRGMDPNADSVGAGLSVCDSRRRRWDGLTQGEKASLTRSMYYLTTRAYGRGERRSHAGPCVGRPDPRSSNSNSPAWVDTFTPSRWWKACSTGPTKITGMPARYA